MSDELIGMAMNHFLYMAGSDFGKFALAFKWKLTC